MLMFFNCMFFLSLLFVYPSVAVQSQPASHPSQFVGQVQLDPIHSSFPPPVGSKATRGEFNVRRARKAMAFQSQAIAEINVVYGGVNAAPNAH